MTNDARFESIAEALEANLRELVAVGSLRPGNILVIGTSTSEILGHRIGTSGTLDVAKPIFETTPSREALGSICASSNQKTTITR